MAIVHEFAPAKINLTLEVLGKRADGYHELQSLVAFADARDQVTLDLSQPLAVTVSGPFAGSLAGTNLIETTLQLIAREAPALRLGTVHLEKNLPVAAGIGGGSADAAAVMRAVQSANPQAGRDVDWTALAVRIGADVPVCLTSRLSWMSGLGERVTRLNLSTPPAIPAVIVNPLVPVPTDKTAQVFRALRASPLPENFAPADLPEIRTEGDLLRTVRSSQNSLETPCRAVVPAVDDVLKELEALPGAQLTRMSGGGPTCFALFESSAAAQAAAALLAVAHPSWWVRAATLN